MSERHVLWVNQYVATPSENSGARHYGLGRGLVAAGWAVTILASDFDHHRRAFTKRLKATDSRLIWETFDGVRFGWLWTYPYSRNDWRRAVNMLSFAWQLVHVRGSVGAPSVVIGSTPHLFAALGAYLLSVRWRVPFVLEVRDLWPESLEAVTGRRGLPYFALHRLAAFLYRRAARVIVLASGVGEVLRSRGVPTSKVVYVPNGVDPAAFPQGSRSERSGLTVIYAGAHGVANGLDAVIDAAQELRGRKEIRFLLVGDGPEKQRLETLAREMKLSNVEFRAAMPKGDLIALFAEADVGLMVLRRTPLFAYGVSPNKLFDYLASGLMVASNVPGDVEAMVTASGAGETAFDGTGAALAAALCRLANRTPAERRAMRTAGREWVLGTHDRTQQAALVGAVLGELAAS